MKKKLPQTLSALSRMRGLSLVELMIAMTIGLILMVAVGYIYLGNAQTFRSLDDFSRIQENYRYALEQIGSELRMAGYAGCALVALPGAAPWPSTDPRSIALSRGVEAYSNGAGWTNAAANAAPQAAGMPPRDVLQISLAQGAAAFVTGVAGAAYQIDDNPANLIANENAIISRCNAPAAVFAISAVGTNSITPVGGLIPNLNLGTEIYRLTNRSYYIGTKNANGALVTSLYRAEAGALPEELIENVEALVVMLGVDTGEDLEADVYLPPAAVVDWQKVVSVRLNLVFVSNQTNTATQQVGYAVEGINYNSPDNHLRQVATVTYGLRSRLPTS